MTARKIVKLSIPLGDNASTTVATMLTTIIGKTSVIILKCETSREKIKTRIELINIDPTNMLILPIMVFSLPLIPNFFSPPNLRPIISTNPSPPETHPIISRAVGFALSIPVEGT